MRLVCPNCGAQYEVPADVISAEGRDVQCSNCGITWYQPSPVAMTAGAAAPAQVDPNDEWVDEAEDEADPDQDDWSEAEDEPTDEADDAAFEDEEPDARRDADGAEEDFAEGFDEAEPDEEFVEHPDEGARGGIFAEEDEEAEDFEETFDEDYEEDDDAADESPLPDALPEVDAFDDEFEEDLAAPRRPDPSLAAAVADTLPPGQTDGQVDEDAPDAADYLDSDGLDSDFPEDGYPESDDVDESDDHEDDEDDEAEAPEAPRAGMVAPRRPLSADVQSVLQAEAAYEARVRTRSADPLESQPELGLGEPETEAQRRERESRERLARLRGMTAMAAAAPAARLSAPADPDPDPGPDAEAQAASRRDLLPDIEEINSSLRTKGERAAAERAAAPEVDTHAQRRGFRLGFGLMLLLAAVLILLYMHADWVRQTVPALEETTDTYVDVANSFRAWLNGQAVRLQAWMEGMTE